MGRKVLVCSCERTMPSYGECAARGCAGAQIVTADQACGADLEHVRTVLAGEDPVTIGCTQQAPLFKRLAEELGFAGELAFANIRENAGWSAESAAAGPKAAALLAMAAEPAAAPSSAQLSSGGVILIYGRDEAAIDAGRKLADKLDVTVLLSRPGDVMAPRTWDFPVARGTIRTAVGHLGAFELLVDDFALPTPSSRGALQFGPPRDGALSRCDLVLDLSGGPALFPAHELRDGYLKADPADRASLAEAIWKAADLVGEFDKPLYIEFSADLCAHSRSRVVGCTRCLDLCPTGAIAPAGDHVSIDPYVCAGCGACAAACPTGAAAYALPPIDALLQRLRTLLLTYERAGGRNAVVLFHDDEHGAPLIDALARYGDGLPSNVLPVAVNVTPQLGVEAWTAPFAWGASAVVALSRAKPRHDPSGLVRTIAIANLLTGSLGYGADRCLHVETDDPDALRAALDRIPAGVVSPRPATFLPLGRKRSVLEAAMLGLRDAAPAPVDFIALPGGAPFGGLEIDVAGCTLCLACVSACPTGALSDSQEKPALHFAERACVQCGLCAATCPEKVIALAPRLDFSAWRTPSRLVKEEEPFRCIRCGEPFGTKSTVERIVAKLQGKHWMFSGANAHRLDVVRMCENCRAGAALGDGLDPHAGAERPRPRTSEDYLRARRPPTDDPS